jgi:hypothetical protein
VLISLQAGQGRNCFGGLSDNSVAAVMKENGPLATVRQEALLARAEPSESIARDDVIERITNGQRD